jgi:group I intron endonuclease
MNQPKCVIYRIFHNESNKSYIGQCSRGLARVLDHFKSYKIKSREYRAKMLYRAMNKYGSDCFSYEIIENCSSKEEMNIREDFWINHFQTRDPTKGYNIRRGGTGGDTWSHLSVEERIVRSHRQSEAQRDKYTDERKHNCRTRMQAIRSDPERSKKNRDIHRERMKKLNEDPEFRLAIQKKGREIRVQNILNGKALESKPMSYVSFRKDKAVWVIQLSPVILEKLSGTRFLRRYQTLQQALDVRDELLMRVGIPIPKREQDS